VRCQVINWGYSTFDIRHISDLRFRTKFSSLKNQIIFDVMNSRKISDFSPRAFQRCVFRHARGHRRTNYEYYHLMAFQFFLNIFKASFRSNIKNCNFYRFWWIRGQNDRQLTLSRRNFTIFELKSSIFLKAIQLIYFKKLGEKNGHSARPG